jgi:hypothetical protein
LLVTALAQARIEFLAPTGGHYQTHSSQVFLCGLVACRFGSHMADIGFGDAELQ